MSKKRPPYLPGRYYHIYNRGCRRLPIFQHHDDYLYAIREIKKYARKYDLTPIAYSLLPNHYHFLTRQEGTARAGLLAERVFNNYARWFNNRYDLSGTLFEGPFRLKVVDKSDYLLHLCRYIHANPVSHGLVSHVADWPYSNYLEWIGARDGTLVDREFVSTYFPATEDYRAFVSAYINAGSPPVDDVEW